MGKRYQNLITEGMHERIDGTKTETDEGDSTEFLRVIFEQWSQCARERHQKRQRHEQETALKQRQIKDFTLANVTQRTNLSADLCKSRVVVSEAVVPKLPPVHVVDNATQVEPSPLAQTLQREWPSPRPSPHYDLKVWNVLGEIAREDETIRSPDMSPRVLSARSLNTIV